MTISSDEKFVKMTTFPLQCTKPWQYFTHPYLKPSFVSSGNNFHLPIYFRTGSLTYYLMKRVHEYVDLYLSPRAIQFLVNIPT